MSDLTLGEETPGDDDPASGEQSVVHRDAPVEKVEPTPRSALVGFMAVPVHRLVPIRRSTLLLAAAFLGFGAWCYLYPPSSVVVVPPGGAVVIPGVIPPTTTTTTTTLPPTTTTTTTTSPSGSSSTSTTAPRSASSTTTTTPGGTGQTTTTP